MYSIHNKSFNRRVNADIKKRHPFVASVSFCRLRKMLMNDAVYKFKRYEDSSLSYTGINKHEGEDIGLYDTVLSLKDHPVTFTNVTEPV